MVASESYLVRPFVRICIVIIRFMIILIHIISFIICTGGRENQDTDIFGLLHTFMLNMNIYDIIATPPL